MSEIILVVENVKETVKQYQMLFENVEIVEMTNYEVGLNEAVIKVTDMQLHLMDENPEYGLNTYKGDEPLPFTINVTVDDIKRINEKVLELNLEVVMELTHMEKCGVSNMIFIDSFGYSWMIHQVHEIKSFEERTKVIEEELAIEQVD